MNIDCFGSQPDVGVVQADTLMPKLVSQPTQTGASLNSDVDAAASLALPLTSTEDSFGQMASSYVQSLASNLGNQVVAKLTNLTGADSSVGSAETADSLLQQASASASTQVLKAALVSPFRIQAEDMQLDTYQIEESSAANSNKLISLFTEKGWKKTGTATSVFQGPEGTYDVVLGYFDENDGVASIEAKINGKSVSQLSLDKNLYWTTSERSFTTEAIATKVYLKPGDTLELIGKETQGEYARIDYVEFVPVAGASKPQPTQPDVSVVPKDEVPGSTGGSGALPTDKTDSGDGTQGEVTVPDAAPPSSPGPVVSNPSTGGTVNSVQTIADDMTLPHAGRPSGVPEFWSWGSGPNMYLGNDPGEFKSMTAWGQLYEDEAGNPATNTRVQLQGMKSYILSKSTGEWQLVQENVIEGSAFLETYADNVNTPPDLQFEEDGTVSVTAGDGYNFHFWPKGTRPTIDPDDIAGVFTTVQARLIVDDANKPDDRASAKYLLSMGGDYWLDETGGWDDFKTNGGIAIGRFKYVTSNWQAFNMSTLTAEQLQDNPPPMD
ncbi:hypothetical protein ACQ4M4_08870 [Leptolyngbya sp. AN02str]|uniref:hypothetical protein n=1 Tax=Leptolyngbya sp. AN02str TaxID=3423363 RepID=UPI003D319148